MTACVSCGEPLVGEYCHHCGEKRTDERDLTLSAFLHYALEAVTNADARLYRTLRALLGSPGLLTREFVAGRRRLYVAPLQLFLVMNVVFFVVLQVRAGTDAFTTDLLFHPGQPLYGPVAADLIGQRVGELPERPEGMTSQQWRVLWSVEQQEFRQRFNEATPRYANSLVILMVPLFALAIRFLRRRTLFVRELVFSAHFFAFVLLFLMAFPIMLIPLGLLLTALQVPVGIDLLEFLFSLGLTATFATYLMLAFRTAHGDRWLPAVARAVTAVFLLFGVLTVYRAILFFVVYWAV